jgi:hypothetical protein
VTGSRTDVSGLTPNMVPDLGRLIAYREGAAMEMYAARYPRGHEFPISTFFWGALIFLALFVLCLLAVKAVERLRNRGESEAVAQEDGDPEVHQMPWDNEVSRTSSDQYFHGGWSGYGGMNEREQEEFWSTYGTGKVRKAMRKRRKAREHAQKHRRDFEP